MRISFGGDGTDLPAYCERNGGLVVSTSIGYGFYTLLNTAPEDGVQILSADHRTLSLSASQEDLILDEGLQLPSSIIDFFNPRSGLTVFLASEVPAGSGLGVCGALTVSMIKGLSFWCGIDLEPAATADIACQIQIDRLGMPVGRQDQYAAAFGGMNRIRFSSDGVSVEPLRLPPGTEMALQQSLMLFFTGVSRRSSNILHQLRQSIRDGDGEVLSRLGAVKDLTSEIGDALEQDNLSLFGELLHRAWVEKRHLVEGITNPFIDQCYQTARDHGAGGGKISGAGGGGFLILYCVKERQKDVTEALRELGVQRWPLALDHQGVQLMQATPWQRLSSDTIRWDGTGRPERQRLRSL
jgi:D-glycero-alpha-D-manno-heptose-7-phosphate kinase